MLRRNMTSAECQISDSKGRYLVFTLLFFHMPMMKTQDLNTKIITKKPKSARNCESRVKYSEDSTEKPFSRVRIAKGIMQLTREQRNAKKYTIRNADTEPRQVIVEHPARKNGNLPLHAEARGILAVVSPLPR